MIRIGRNKSPALAMSLCCLFVAVATAAVGCDRPRGQAAAATARGTPATAPASAGPRIEFPADDALPRDRFGLFIGIDTYPNLPGHNLDGCVRDATSLKDIFSTRFGVKRFVILTDTRATRANIGQALRALIEQVRLARARSSGTITVVITYAGHGSRVRRRDSDPAKADDPYESTWVASDSPGLGEDGGDKDVRASELYAAHSELSRLGAQVILISDSCHSGPGFRGGEKARAIDRPAPPAGPRDELFADLRAAQPAGGGAGDGPLGAGRPLPGFVWYAACGSGQVAWEGHDDENRPCGRLSYALRRLLPEVAPKTTYAELATRIATRFAADYPQQRPEFHAAAGKSEERFLTGGFPPPHAEIVAGSLKAGTAGLTMGRGHGVSKLGRFTFYDSSDDLEHRRNPLATAEVVDVQPLTCTVRLPAGAAVPPTAWAALDAIRVEDFTVAADGPLPSEPARAAVADSPDAGDDLQLGTTGRGDEDAPLPEEIR